MLFANLHPTRVGPYEDYSGNSDSSNCVFLAAVYWTNAAVVEGWSVDVDLDSGPAEVCKGTTKTCWRFAVRTAVDSTAVRDLRTVVELVIIAIAAVAGNGNLRGDRRKLPGSDTAP